MYKTLASWRGLLVVVIVLYHTPLLVFTEVSHMSVSLFVMMSGTLLAMRHPRVDCSWWQWIKPRARRIYPIHWLVLALLALIQIPRGTFNISPLLPANVLLLHTWIPVRDAYFSYIKPSWFLAALLTCYACYPLLIDGISRLRMRGRWILAGGIMGFHCLVMWAASPAVRDWLFVMPLSRMTEFVWGIILGLTMPSLEHTLGETLHRHATAIELAVITFVAIVIVAVRAMPWLDCCEDMTAWWIPASLIIVSCIILSDNEGIVGKVMRSRPLIWLGSLSLEIYMLAPLVSYLYSHYLAGLAAHLGHPEFYDISWPITLPLTILTATIIHPIIKKRK